jgi:predicted  nucleic acid-binding Zn-ribbon protein
MRDEVALREVRTLEKRVKSLEKEVKDLEKEVKQIENNFLKFKKAILYLVEFSQDYLKEELK